VVPGDKATDQENNRYIFDFSMYIELLLPPIRKKTPERRFCKITHEVFFYQPALHYNIRRQRRFPFPEHGDEKAWVGDWE
jgi:hypothetical protein